MVGALERIEQRGVQCVFIDQMEREIDPEERRITRRYRNAVTIVSLPYAWLYQVYPTTGGRFNQKSVYLFLAAACC